MTDPRGHLRKAGASSTLTFEPTRVDAAAAEAVLVEQGAEIPQRGGRSRPSR